LIFSGESLKPSDIVQLAVITLCRPLIDVTTSKTGPGSKNVNARLSGKSHIGSIVSFCLREDVFFAIMVHPTKTEMP